MRVTTMWEVEHSMELSQSRCAERLHADEESHRGAPSPGGSGKRAVEQGERGRLVPDLRMLSHSVVSDSLQPYGW